MNEKEFYKEKYKKRKNGKRKAINRKRKYRYDAEKQREKRNIAFPSYDFSGLFTTEDQGKGKGRKREKTKKD